ncbi:uncharacterized protein LOC142338679 [Convolutriloba macropyga]|uniref:uncharacterized protein LOC142338679 n=1 Tax=Convolutriloba macropyga TaxID=536237 RepID=UPI003F51B12B
MTWNFFQLILINCCWTGFDHGIVSCVIIPEEQVYYVHRLVLYLWRCVEKRDENQCDENKARKTVGSIRKAIDPNPLFPVTLSSSSKPLYSNDAASTSVAHNLWSREENNTGTEKKPI